ncbi:TniQ family protein [Aliarcobacter cryaerophilus]|uniref:TniQ family protein n=1 Tax=Aliarcobacter cryaerophilus TaxID=28198 RepID=UPI003DA44637
MKIVIEPQVYNNEILSSWLIRSSIKNGSEPSSWTTMIFNDNKFWSKDPDRFIEDKEIYKLVKGCNKSFQELKNMTLEPLYKKILGNDNLNSKKAWTFIISTGQRGTYRRNGTYFCPLCLKNEKEFILRKEFRLAWNISCSIHKINLLQKCQKCDTNFTPYKITFDKAKPFLCTKCGFDLRKSNTKKPNEEVVIFQEKLNDAIFNEKIDRNFPIVDLKVDELFKTLRILLSFLRALMKTNKSTTFLKKLNLEHLKKQLEEIKTSDNFEDMELKAREFYLLLVSRLFSLKIEDIKKIFKELDFTYKLVAKQSTLYSKTIDYITKNLKVNSKNKDVVNTKEITPKSKEEVKFLLEELKSCL